MRELLNQTAAIAARYLEALDGRGVAPTAEALARLAELTLDYRDLASREWKRCTRIEFDLSRQVESQHRSG